MTRNYTVTKPAASNGITVNVPLSFGIDSSPAQHKSQTTTGTAVGTAATIDLLPKRGNWGSPIEFVLACVGYAIGLGNVWRFPHLVFRNGGGAFLIPYILMVFLIGLPIFFSELFIGQYSGVGPNKAYSRMAPFFHGLGYCTLVVITFVTIYYMVIVSWILFYLFASFSSEFGWARCDHEYNTDRCFSGVADLVCKENNTNNGNDMIFWGRKCTEINEICLDNQLVGVNSSFCRNPLNDTEIPLRQIIKRVTASEEYYNEFVLGVGSSSWSDWGYPRWPLVLCLMLGWAIAFLCVIKGIQSAGKVVYFTAIFPYVILTALLIRGITLDGSMDGILFYIRPEWDRLLEPAVWGDAASQTFYSFGIACGSLVTLASYNKFTNNIQTDALFVSLTNVFTSIFAGFTIFAIVGFMAKKMGVPVSEVVTEGPGLAFIAYPEAVNLMPLPQLWAILFFFMMLILGMGSQFAGIEAINTAVIDHWPHLRKHKWRVTAGTCICCFIAGLPMVCNGGIYLFTLMDWHTASWAVLLLGIAEVVVISWVYGMDRALANLADMGMKMGKLLGYYWRTVWIAVTPAACLAVFIFTMTGIEPTRYGDYVFPAWADLIGWLIGALTLVPFPMFIAYRYYKGRPTAWFKPSSTWRAQDVGVDADGARRFSASTSSIASMLQTERPDSTNHF